jgi:hypothetical protein
MKRVSRERFAELLEKHKNDDYPLSLRGWQVPIMHGLVAVAADHPGIQAMHEPTKRVINQFREWCKMVFIQWGFTAEEAEYLDQMRQEIRK